jgi:hypothetical protein
MSERILLLSAATLFKKCRLFTNLGRQNKIINQLQLVFFDC